jgi:hypothetical protein
VLVAAAFCPHPPLLVAPVAVRPTPELAEVGAACDRAVTRLVEADPDVVVLVGAGPRPARWSDGDGGSMAGYGVDLPVPLRGPVRPGREPMPLSLTVGAWLLGRAGHAGERIGFCVPDGADDGQLAGWADRIGDLGDRLALLVMGDGSARRSEQAPGYLDPRAEPFDAAVAAALAAGDPAALRRLDPVLGAELLAAGTAPWRLAGHLGGDSRFAAALLHDAAPYGVGYLVASWWPA